MQFYHYIEVTSMQIDMQLEKEMEELKRQRDVAQLQLDEMRRKVHNEQPV